MKILFADKFPVSEQANLSQHQCHNQFDLTADDLPAAIGDAEILVVRSTKVTAQTIAAAEKLKLIIRAGAGTNTIDKSYAAEQGIAVCNTPGKNAVAVAELAMGLMLALDRRIPAATADLKQKVWNKKYYSVADGIYGKSVGIVGFGAIGQEFAKRAHAFGLQLHVYDRNGKLQGSELHQQMGFTTHADMVDLLQAVDIVSLHVPLNDATTNMLNGDLLAAMRDNAMLINTSRGEVIDEAALLDALDNKGLRAGLDVFCDEPAGGSGEFVSPIAQHPNVVGTHHIGASTQQAQLAVAHGVINVVNSFVAGQLIHRVN